MTLSVTSPEPNTSVELPRLVGNLFESRHHPDQPDDENPEVTYSKRELQEKAYATYGGMFGGLIPQLQVNSAPPASDADIRLAHTQTFLDRMTGEIETARLLQAVFDTGVRPAADPKMVVSHGKVLREAGPSFHVGAESEAALRTSTGAGLHLLDLVLKEEITRGIAAVRPPGHHSGADEAYGFCGFNTAAVMAKKAVAEGKKVAIVDLDIHHGNGTKEIVAGDPGILLIDLCIRGKNEYPFSEEHRPDYYTGPAYDYDTKASNVEQIEMPYGTSGDAWLENFITRALPRILEQNPDVIVLSAGFDCADGDPIGGFKVTPAHYYRAVRLLAALGKPVIVLTEGGYEPDHIPDFMAATTKALIPDGKSHSKRELADLHRLRELQRSLRAARWSEP